MVSCEKKTKLTSLGNVSLSRLSASYLFARRVFQHYTAFISGRQNLSVQLKMRKGAHSSIAKENVLAFFSNQSIRQCKRDYFAWLLFDLRRESRFRIIGKSNLKSFQSSLSYPTLLSTAGGEIHNNLWTHWTLCYH